MRLIRTQKPGSKNEQSNEFREKSISDQLLFVANCSRQNPKKTDHIRVKDLLSRMTLEDEADS